MWECGLKPQRSPCGRNGYKNVTPYVGVWIETHRIVLCGYRRVVTPYVGVWIETINRNVHTVTRTGHSLCGSVD